jgi:hypothetical protein
VKAEAQLVSGNELRFFFANRSNQTIYLPLKAKRTAAMNGCGSRDAERER